MKCINSCNFWNYANGWRHPKKGKSKKDKLETTNITEEHKKESSLMEIEEADNENLLQGISQVELKNGLGIDAGKSSHMIGEKNLLHEIDDAYKGGVRFVRWIKY